jgi:hypothetical protein
MSNTYQEKIAAARKALEEKLQAPFHIAIYACDELQDVYVYDNVDRMPEGQDEATEWLGKDGDDYGAVGYVVVINGEVWEEGAINGEYDASDDLYEAYRDRQMGL